MDIPFTEGALDNIFLLSKSEDNLSLLTSSGCQKSFTGVLWASGVLNFCVNCAESADIFANSLRQKKIVWEYRTGLGLNE